MSTFSVDGLGAPLRLIHFEGEEAISRLFRFRLTVSSEDPDLAPATVVGRGSQITIPTSRGPRFIHGIVGRFEVGDAGVVHEAGVAQMTCYVTLVPWVERLRRRRDSRIFQNLTTPQILQQVLAKGGPSRLALTGAYRPRDYCVQYGESDWDFASRLMEEDGIHYFFENEEGSHVLVVSDFATGHAPIPGGVLPFRTESGALRGQERVTRFRYGEEAHPDKVTLRDYNFERPSLEMESSAGGGETEVYEHPGDFDLPAEGTALASLRLEEAQVFRGSGEGESDSATLVPGWQLELVDHPTEALNGAYLVTRVEHRLGGTTAESYQNRFHVIPAAVPFRPPRTTPRPTIRVQTAIVVGPPGEEIYTDAHGRVKVRFHWDRSGRDDERCSCWIRVSQASAGPAFGALFLPRVGHEVVVDFLDGNPDRPIVTGSVYHAANVPPYSLPAEKTKSTLKTQSSPGGNGSNELRFEDRKGSEEVYLHAQKDLKIAVEHDKHQSVGQDEDLFVTRTRTVTVLGAHTETIGLAQTITVGAALTETVGGFLTETVGGFLTVTVGLYKTETVGLASTERVFGKKSSKIGRNYTLTVGGNITERAVGKVSVTAGRDASFAAEGSWEGSARADVSLKAGKGMNVLAGSSIYVDAGDGLTMNVEGAHEDHASTNRVVGADEEVTIRCGSSTITMKKDGTIEISGNDITLTSKNPVKVNGKKIHVKSDSGVTVEATGNVKVKGSNVGFN